MLLGKFEPYTVKVVLTPLIAEVGETEVTFGSTTV